MKKLSMSLIILLISYAVLFSANDKLYEIDRDGVTREKKFTYDENGFIQVEERFDGISTKTFIVK